MRKLAIFALAFSATVFSANYFVPLGVLPYVSCAFAVIGAASFLLKDGRRMYCILISFGVFAGAIWFFGYSQLFVMPAYELDGRTECVSAVVIDFPEHTEYGEKIDVKLKSDGIPAAKASVFAFGTVNSGAKPGDIIKFTAEFSRRDVINGEETDTYTSSGFFLSCFCYDGIEITDKSGEGRYFYRYISRAMSSVLESSFPDDTEGLLTALICGDRTKLYGDYELVYSMKTSGIFHVVSVSGMHVCILAGFIQTLVRRKKLASVITIPVLLVFAGVTGFAPSVIRAVIMEALLIAAPLFKREADGLTSLGAGLLAILLANPYAIGSIGLQLSFAAAFGIIVLTPRLYSKIYDALKEKRKAKKSKLAKFVIASFTTSVGAMAFTVPITAIYFGYVSLVSVVANLLISWAVSVVFCGGLIVCIIGAVFLPAAKIAAFPVMIVAKYIIYVSKALSGLSFSAVYTENIYIIFWLIYVYLLAVASAVMRVKIRRLLLPASLGVITLCIILCATSIFKGGSDFSVTVRDVGQGQCVVLNSGEYTAVVDCGSTTDSNCGEETVSYIKSCGRDNIDLLILTHFHDDHISGVMQVLQSMDVTAVAMPLPDADDTESSDEIIEYASENDIEVIFVVADMSVNMGTLDLSLFAPLEYNSENEYGIIVLASYGEADTLITGDVNTSVEDRLLEHTELPDIELLVAGHHGSKYSTGEKLLNETSPETAVISVGHNSYGHPADEVLKRLENNGISVYRTDVNGDITFNVG